MHKSEFIEVSFIDRFGEGGFGVCMRVEACATGWAGASRLGVCKQAISLTAVTLCSRAYPSLEN